MKYTETCKCGKEYYIPTVGDYVDYGVCEDCIRITVTKRKEKEE